MEQDILEMYLLVLGMVSLSDVGLLHNSTAIQLLKMKKDPLFLILVTGMVNINCVNT